MPTPFTFRTPTEAAAQAATLDEAFAAALSEGNEETGVRSRMLAGIAGRPDLTNPAARKILKYRQHEDHSVLVALLNNEHLSMTEKTRREVCARFTPYAVFTLVDELRDPVRYLPDMLRAVAYANQDQTYEFLISSFTPSQVDEAIGSMIQELVRFVHGQQDTYHQGSSVLVMPVLNSTHLDPLVDAVVEVFNIEPMEDPYFSEVHASARTVLERLFALTCLSEEQWHRIFDCVEILINFEMEELARYADWQKEAYPGASHGPRLGLATVRGLFHQTSLPDSVIVRALKNEVIVNELIPHPSSSSTRQHIPAITFSAVVDAVRAGANPLLLVNYSHGNLPYDVVEIVAKYLRNESRVTVEAKRTFTRMAVRHIGTPAWETIYEHYLSTSNRTHTETVDEFVEFVIDRHLGHIDKSRTTRAEQVAAWASTSADPVLRRHAVKHAYTPEQLTRALDDPDPLVRREVLTHEMCSSGHVHTASLDADSSVRVLAAGHALASVEVIQRLASDPDEGVRRVTAERVLDALATA